MATSCAAALQSYGVPCKSGNNLSVVVGALIVRRGFQFSANDLADEATVKGWILNEDAIGIQQIDDTEAYDEEEVLYKSPTTGLDRTRREKVRGYKFKSEIPLKNHKLLRENNGLNLDIIYIDTNYNVIFKKATSDIEFDPTASTCTGIRIGSFRVESLTSFSIETPVQTVVKVQELSAKDLDKFGTYFEPEYDPTTLYGIETIKLTASAITSNAFTITAQRFDASELTSSGDVELGNIVGFVEDNIEVRNTATTGDEVTGYAFNDNGDGTYSIDTTTVSTGTSVVPGDTVKIKPSLTMLFKSSDFTLT